MTTRTTLAAGLTAALGLAAPTAASAADLYGEAPRYGYEQSYDDDRYAEGERRYDPGDRYGYDEYGRYDEPRYGHRYQGSTKDGEYLPPVERAPRFSEEHAPGGYACAPRWQVRNRLQADGWRNFQRLAVRPRVVIIRAERPNGRAFDLKLDRCSGAILAERPARFRGYGAYGPGPRRYGWAY